MAETSWGIVVAGVGGTGVITIGQLLGMAAHIEGKGIVTQDAAGLAQKGGATWSHVLIGDSQRRCDPAPPSVGTAAADLVILACDPLVSRQQEHDGGACAKAAPMWRSTATAARPPPS